MSTYKISPVPEYVHRCIQDFDSDLGHDVYRQLLRACCLDCNSDLSRRVLNALDYLDSEDHILEICDISPLSYTDWKSYLKDAQLCALVKKYPALRTDYQPKLEAMKTFIACESVCQRFNEFFVSKLFLRDFAAGTFFGLVREKIQSILGPAPNIGELTFEFGPGAAYSIKKNTASLDKLAGSLDVTPNCYKSAIEFIGTCPGWRTNDDFLIMGPPKPKQLTIVAGDRLSFVPKTAKTDRPIAIGPLINGLIQKGLGKAIRRRLKPHLNLSVGQDKHKMMALRGSIDGYYSTIDLKSASDTISYEIVRQLIPHEWFVLLDSCRSEWYEIDGKVYPYHKFSAMGNGYTFELETLIFYAISLAACRLEVGHPDVSVYGDDIIIPSQFYGEVTRQLVFCGFTLNSDKSFACGPFRESCGGDFFSGVSVRPYNHKGFTTYRTLFLLHNHLVREGTQFIFVNLYRRVRKLLGNSLLRYFKTFNDLDDGALLDFSMPVGNYNRIVPKVIGLRHNAKKSTYGASLCLYRLMSRNQATEEDINWRSYKSHLYRVRHKLYRYVHI